MKFMDCRIIFSDPSRHCCDAISTDGINLFENVNYAETGLKQSGKDYHPEIGDIIVIELSDDGQVRLHKYYSYVHSDSNKETSFQVGSGPSLNKNRELSGDLALTGPDGSWLNLIRGRLAGVGAGPMAQTIWAGMEGLIRNVAMNYDTIGSGLRLFSINDNGNVTTRLCFSGTDQLVTTGYNENPLSSSENFEYQFDITKDGFTIFVGNIDPTTHKRINNLTITFNPQGDIQVISGKNTIFNMYSSGASSFKMFDDLKNIVYNKSVALVPNHTSAFVKEYIKGNVVRKIEGNLDEEITGHHHKKVDTNMVNANIIDNTTVVNKTSSSLNIPSLESTKS